jgi:hypothetical protein
MEATNTSLGAVASSDPHVAKRTASDEVEDAPATKRAGISKALSTSSNEHEPKPTSKAQLLEKVC